MFTTTSALLATYTGYEAFFLFIYLFFLLPWQYHSVSWSEASLGAKIHLCGWIQSWIRPQINSCIIMIKSCTVYRLPFIISFIQRPVYTTKVQETADTLKDASTILQIKHECYIYASCLFHLRLLWCLWLGSSRLAVLHRSTTAAAMLGYVNLRPDCAAQCLMSESSQFFRTTRWRKRGHRRPPVSLRNQIRAIKF